MDDLTKYALEVRFYEVDFVDDLQVGDTLTGVPTVTTDVEGVVVDPGTISRSSSTRVRFRLSGGTPRARGHVTCTCPTMGNETMEARPALRVLA